MEFAQSLVCLAYQSMGYFIIEGIKAPGNREVDILAVKLDGDGKRVIEKLHIEVQVSINPIAGLRSKSSMKDSLINWRESAEKYITKKWKNKEIVKVVKSNFGDDNYKKVFVYGKLRKEEQREILKEKGIEVISIAELIKRAFKANPTQEFKRIVSVFGVLK
jgi:response regulator RpfG family c-di-GMP phosphodiesterase